MQARGGNRGGERGTSRLPLSVEPDAALDLMTLRS